MRLIDADKLKFRKFQDNGEWYRQGWNDAIDAIVAYEPTAQPERKKGEWIAVSEYGRWMRKCNSCGWKQFIDSPKMRGWHYNYCPNCGADMRGEER